MNRESMLWVLEQIGINRIFPSGKNVMISCPLAKWKKGHSGDVDHKPSMGISIDSDNESLVHCFACRFGGTFQRLVEELHNLSENDYSQLIRKIAEIEQIDPDTLVNSIGDWSEKKNTYVEKIIDESEIKPMLGRAHPYLIKKRDLSIEALKAWSVGYDEKKKRSIFPVRRKDGALVGVVGRSIFESQRPKYMNYFNFDKGRYLAGEHIIKDGSTLIVCEGFIDAVSVWGLLHREDLLDRYSVVALLGSKATDFQCEKLVKFSDDVILFLDNDPAGWTGQLSIIRALGKKIRVNVIIYIDHIGGDPAFLIAHGFNVRKMIEDAEMILS